MVSITRPNRIPLFTPFLESFLSKSSEFLIVITVDAIIIISVVLIIITIVIMLLIIIIITLINIVTLGLSFFPKSQGIR